jgi:hypothetical protein
MLLTRIERLDSGRVLHLGNVAPKSGKHDATELGFLSPNLVGIDGPRTYITIVPVLISPGTSQVRLRLPPGAGAASLL